MGVGENKRRNKLIISFKTLFQLSQGEAMINKRYKRGKATESVSVTLKALHKHCFKCVSYLNFKGFTKFSKRNFAYAVRSQIHLEINVK